MLAVVAKTPHRNDPPASPLGRIDERELVTRCKAGERAAHDELYHRFRRAVAANLYRVIGDRGELDDLVQEVFVIAFRGLERFRGDAKLSTWLYRICVNVALGRLRAKGRKGGETVPYGDLFADTDDGAASPEERAGAREEAVQELRERRV